MALDIERARYYDGEFLTSADFTAEQKYHLETRRRLHMAMNMWGIVDGLDIQSDTEGTVKTFSIAPGTAIDAYGREIFVGAPYQLDDSVLQANIINKVGRYVLLIRYKVDPATPPSNGYGQCQGGNQLTRGPASFESALKPAP